VVLLEVVMFEFVVTLPRMKVVLMHPCAVLGFRANGYEYED
jgi:hypothetical protein